LFYRLNVIEVALPPLRERIEDIALLAKHFVAKSARNQNSAEKQITSEAMAALASYTWPGNVRELENAIERAYILSGDVIDLDNMPQKVRDAAAHSLPVRDGDGFRPTLEEMERRYLMEILNSVAHDKAKAAHILGIDLSTLYRKLKRYEEI
jgi:DNA-binding NtrC family response regulator